MADYVVKCAVAQLLGPDGSYSHHYEGAPVPELAEGVAESLLEQGLIGVADQVPVPEAHASDAAPVPAARAQPRLKPGK